MDASESCACVVIPHVPLHHCPHSDVSALETPFLAIEAECRSHSLMATGDASCHMLWAEGYRSRPAPQLVELTMALNRAAHHFQVHASIASLDEMLVPQLFENIWKLLWRSNTHQYITFTPERAWISPCKYQAIVIEINIKILLKCTLQTAQQVFLRNPIKLQQLEIEVWDAHRARKCQSRRSVLLKHLWYIYDRLELINSHR